MKPARVLKALLFAAALCAIVPPVAADPAADASGPAAGVRIDRDFKAAILRTFTAATRPAAAPNREDDP